MKIKLQTPQSWVRQLFLASVVVTLFLNPGVGYVQGSSNSADLACAERQLLDLAVPNTFPGVPTVPLVGIDSAGNILAAWGYNFSDPGELYTARFDVGSGWGPKTLLDTGSAMDRVYLSGIAVNSSGAGLLAWSGQRGLYAAAYLPGSGWQETQTIISGTSPFLLFANIIGLTIDSTGNGLLVWANDNGNVLYSSRYTPGSGGVHRR